MADEARQDGTSNQGRTLLESAGFQSGWKVIRFRRGDFAPSGLRALYRTLELPGGNPLKDAQDYARIHRVRFCIELLAIALVLAGILWAVIGTLHLLTPRSVTMVTGPEGGSYHQIGERYRRRLVREEIDLRLLPTEDAVENLIKLNDANSAVIVQDETVIPAIRLPV